MSMDHDGRQSGHDAPQSETPLFAPNPIWDRARTRRGFGRRHKAASAATPAAASPAATIAPEPRTFAAERDYEEPMALDRPVSGPGAESAIGAPASVAEAKGPGMVGMTADTMTTTHRDEVGDAAMVSPIGRATTRRTTHARRGGAGAAPAAIAAGVVALGALGAAGWYATRDNDGIPELAPGQPTTTEVATAPLPPLDTTAGAPVAPAPAQAQTAAPPPAAAPGPRPERATPARAERRLAARTRLATSAPSATDAGMNASTTTTLPGAPQPYSTLNPGATPPPVAPPTQAAPPPTESPAAVPSTPPTLPIPAPAETPTQTPDVPPM